MLIQFIEQLPDNIKKRLDEDQQQAFLKAVNNSHEAGLSEGECYRAGWVAAIEERGRVIPHQFLFRVGEFRTMTHLWKCTPKQVEDGVWSINRRVELNVPTRLLYDHSSDNRSIPLGIISGATCDGDKVYADFVILQDAIEEGRVLATIDQIADALLSGAMKVSIEGYHDVKDREYFGERKLSLDIPQVAILPVEMDPAVPEHIVAGRIIASISEKGEGEMEELLREMKAMLVSVTEGISGIQASLTPADPSDEVKNLKAQIAEKEEELSEVRGKLESIEAKAAEHEVETLMEGVKAKLLPGEVEALDEELKETDGPEEKRAVLARLNKIVAKRPDVDEDERKLIAKASDKQKEFDAEVRAVMEKEGITSRLLAQRKVLDSMEDNDIETEEINI